MSARDPKYPTYPKLWDSPHAVGESQARYMDSVGLPFMTKVGPDFVARKRGQFFEVVSTPREQAAAFIRAVDCAPSTSGGKDVGDAYSRADGSLQLTKAPTSTELKVRRTAKTFAPTMDWVSPDEKTVLTWVSPGRYLTYAEILSTLHFDTWYAYTSGLPRIASYAPVLGFRSYVAQVFSAYVWVNGRKIYVPDFVAYGRVLGAAIYSEAIGGGRIARYLKVVLMPWGFDGGSSAWSGGRIIYDVPANTAHYAHMAAAIALDGNGTTQIHSNLAQDLLSQLGAEETENHVYGTAAPFVFNSSGTEAMCQASPYKEGQYGQVVLNWPGLSRPTWSLRTENFFQDDDSTSTTGDPVDGANVPLGGNGGWTATRTLSWRRPHKADYVWGTDTLVFAHEEGDSTRTTTASFTKTIAENGDKMEGSTTVTSRSDSSGYYLGGAQISSGSYSGGGTATVTNSTPVNAGPGAYSTLTRDSSGSSSGPVGIECFDLRVGLVSIRYLQSSGGVQETITRTPGTQEWLQGYFALGQGAGFGGGPVSSDEYRFHVRLPTDNQGGGATSLLLSTPADALASAVGNYVSPHAEIVIDPRGNGVLVSAYLAGYRLDPPVAEHSPTGAKLGNLGLFAYDRTVSASGASLSYSYTPYAHGIPPDHVLMCLSAPATPAVGTGNNL